MIVRALRAFPFSRDGTTSIAVAIGEEPDIPDALVDGLRKEGFIGDVPTQPVPPPAPAPTKPPAEESEADGQSDGGGQDAVSADIDIPEAWTELPWEEKRKFVLALLGEAPSSKAHAVELVEAEKARRAEVAAAAAAGSAPAAQLP